MLQQDSARTASQSSTWHTGEAIDLERHVRRSCTPLPRESKSRLHEARCMPHGGRSRWRTAGAVCNYPGTLSHLGSSADERGTKSERAGSDVRQRVE